MKRKVSVMVALTVALLVLAPVGATQVPNQMHYQAYLSDSEGSPLDTVLSMTFTIYGDSAGTSVFWTETQPSVSVSNGLFNVLLGSVTPVLDSVFADSVRWLGIAVDPDPDIIPRTKLVTVPYAFRVNTLDGASGGHLFGKLQVESSHQYSGHFTSDSLSSSTQVIHSEFTGTGDYDAKAVYGRCAPEDFYGYGGYFQGGYTGVYGEVSPTGGEAYSGVQAVVSGGGGSNCNMGVQASATGPAANVGVQAHAHGGVENYGVWGHTEGDNFGTSYGIYGSTGNSGTNWAGYFVGDVRVSGIISKGCGGFWIDHPLDPESKYLYHSFVESPDMKNIYDGVVTLDASGEAIVELPDYFQAVNRDFRYQLTCIGGHAPVYVDKEISGDRFSIAGGKAGMRISWQVTGIRKDPFAELNRIQVEVDKPAEVQGKYLHPEAYGLGEEHGVHYERHKRMEEKLRAKSDRRTERE
jgi:hypothetical protein